MKSSGLALLSVLLSGCLVGFGDEDGQVFQTPVSPCQTPLAADLQGRWTLRGSGQRHDCQDARYSGPFQFETSQPLEVISQMSSNGISATFRLASESPGFFLSGQLSGSCFSARTSEALESDSVGFTFSASEVTQAQSVTGAFETQGPRSCLGEGTFELLVQVPTG